MSEASGERFGILPLVFFFLTVLSRLPFSSKFLYHMDSVHFALALDQYDVTVHQPHPPGYFLYVMLGRLLHLFIHDANTVFVTISILFSGLTVVMIYYLYEELFVGRTAVLAAALAITSPNLWFHGEVALSYPVEAFFSVLVAFLCWKIYSGKHEYIWLSAVVLAEAGGVRQNTLFFLLPLWLFSIKKVQPGKIIAALIVLIIVCLSWFVPMVMMTGGWENYRMACKELWEFNTGHQTVFDNVRQVFTYNASLLSTYAFYNLCGGTILLGFAIYHIIRKAKFRLFVKPEAIFICLWSLPTALFYLLIYLHTNPGYALILMPQLVILAALSADYMSAEYEGIFRSCSKFVVIIALFINVLFFLLSKCPVSYADIRTHDKNLKLLISYLENLDPSTTAILVGPYKYYGYRQIMYYLPKYSVYQVDFRVSVDGEIRRTFWGKSRRTFLTDGISLPAGIRKFAAVIYCEDRKKISGIDKVRLHELPPELVVVSGPVAVITKVYPEAANLVKFSGNINYP